MGPSMSFHSHTGPQMVLFCDRTVFWMKTDALFCMNMKSLLWRKIFFKEWGELLLLSVAWSPCKNKNVAFLKKRKCSLICHKSEQMKEPKCFVCLMPFLFCSEPCEWLAGSSLSPTSSSPHGCILVLIFFLVKQILLFAFMIGFLPDFPRVFPQSLPLLWPYIKEKGEGSKK